MNPSPLATLVAAAALAACAAGPAPRTDDIFGRIDPGMSREQVTRLIGPPDETMKFPLSRSEAWDYRYQDAWGYMAIFSVTFGPDGLSASKISRRVNDGGDHAGR